MAERAANADVQFHCPDDAISTDQALTAAHMLYRSLSLCRMFAVMGEEDPVRALTEHADRLRGRIEECPQSPLGARGASTA